VLSLIEEVQSKVDQDEAEAQLKKLQRTSSRSMIFVRSSGR